VSPCASGNPKSVVAVLVIGIGEPVALAGITTKIRCTARV